MDCQRVADDELVEKYLNGQLDPAVQGDLEIHILECSRCLTQAETLKTISTSLASRTQEVYSLRTKPLRGLPWAWVGIAALVVVCVLAVDELRHGVRQPVQAVNAPSQSPQPVLAVPTPLQPTRSEAYLPVQKPQAEKRNSQHGTWIPAVYTFADQRQRTIFPVPGLHFGAYQQSPEAPDFIVFNSGASFRAAREEDAMELVSRRAVFGSVNR